MDTNFIRHPRLGVQKARIDAPKVCAIAHSYTHSRSAHNEGDTIVLVLVLPSLVLQCSDIVDSSVSQNRYRMSPLGGMAAWPSGPA